MKKALTVRIDEEILDKSRDAREIFGHSKFVQNLLEFVYSVDSHVDSQQSNGKIVGKLSTAIGLGDYVGARQLMERGDS